MIPISQMRGLGLRDSSNFTLCIFRSYVNSRGEGDYVYPREDIDSNISLGAAGTFLYPEGHGG